MALTKFFLLIGAAAFIACKSSNQTEIKYMLVSSEGRKHSLDVIENLEDNQLILTLNKRDSVCFRNFTGLNKEPQIQNDSILVLHFSSRGGSGVKYRRQAILSIINGHIRIAADLFADEETNVIAPKASTSDSTAMEVYRTLIDSLYQFTFSQHELKIHEQIYFDINANFKFDTTTRLTFDSNSGIYYNISGTLSEGLQLINEQSRSITFNSGTPFMGIQLSRYIYYFIDNVWYVGASDGKTLGIVSGPCN